MRTSEADAADPTDPEAREEAERHRVAIVNAYQRELKKHRGGRPRPTGEKNTKTHNVRAHIKELLQRHPTLAKSPPALFKKADPKVIGNMSGKTFGDHVRSVRGK